MQPRSFRTTVRWIHLIFSGVLGTWIYSPWGSNAAFSGMVRWAVFPLLAVTGLALWQQRRVLSLLTGRDRTRQPETASGEV